MNILQMFDVHTTGSLAEVIQHKVGPLAMLQKPGVTMSHHGLSIDFELTIASSIGSTGPDHTAIFLRLATLPESFLRSRDLRSHLSHSLVDISHVTIIPGIPTWCSGGRA